MSMLKNKLLVKGELINLSPIIIGTGKSLGWIDIEVIKDENGNFYIPGTSFKGALRHFLKDNYVIPDSDLNIFFGDQDSQAIAIFDDLISINQTKTEIRDGVAIDYKTNIAIDGAKYDYELVPEGYSFNLTIEINLYEDISEENIFKMLATIQHVLKNENKRFCIGAMTTKGFGLLSIDKFNVYHFDNNSNNWINYLLNNTLPAPKQLSKTAYPLRTSNYFSISASFKIKILFLLDQNQVLMMMPIKCH